MTVREAKQNLADIRACHGDGSGYGLQAFQQLSQAYAAEGRRIDELSHRSADELERFFAQTIPGPDGHTYWDGPARFVKNDGVSKVPARWWWEHLHSAIPNTTVRLRPVCGERNCITPAHQLLYQGAPSRRFTDTQMIGSLQVLSLRLGHTPTMRDWDASGLSPSKEMYRERFGTWKKALRAAGLNPVRQTSSRAPFDYVRSLRAAKKLIGHWPTRTEFASPSVRDHLKSRKLPTSTRMVYAKLGAVTWEHALRKAGKK